MTAYTDSLCTSATSYNYSGPLNTCVYHSDFNAYIRYSCLTRPDPTARPTVIPTYRPSRQPSMPYTLTHAPLAPTAKPLLNPASKLTYSPTIMPTNNESAIRSHAKVQSFAKKNLWWIILIIVAVVVLLVIGCLGYRKKRKRQKDMKEAAVQKQKSREKSTREALNSDFQTSAAMSPPPPSYDTVVAGAGNNKPPLPTKQQSGPLQIASPVASGPGRANGAPPRHPSPVTAKQAGADHANYVRAHPEVSVMEHAGLTRTKSTKMRSKQKASSAPLPALAQHGSNQNLAHLASNQNLSRQGSQQTMGITPAPSPPPVSYFS
jgi:hypothetical protein